MIKSDRAVTKGKLLFKYPWRVWIFSVAIYGALSSVPIANYLRRPWRSVDFSFFDNPLYGIAGLLLIIFPIIKIIIYQMYYDDWKKKTLHEVDNPEYFIKELARNNFYLNAEELNIINKPLQRK